MSAGADRRTLVRLSIADDRAEFLRLAAAHIAEIRPDLEFDEEVARLTFATAIRAGEPLLLVAEARDRSLVGFLVGSIRPYATAGQIAVSLDVGFVAPAYRGTTAGPDLLDEFRRWAGRLNAAECFVDDPAWRRGPLVRFITTLRRDLGRRVNAVWS